MKKLIVTITLITLIFTKHTNVGSNYNFSRIKERNLEWDKKIFQDSQFQKKRLS
jgi:hypothetical protein